MRNRVLVTVIALLAACTDCQAAVYVDSRAPGPARDGRSWRTAYTSITEGLNRTRAGDVWVRAGMYRERIVLSGYRRIYGGFAGTETRLDQRPAQGLPTVISAQFAGRAIEVSTGAYCTLDGLMVVNGAAEKGAGILCRTNSTALLRNCRFQNCEARQMGGGVYFDKYSSGEMQRCAVVGNSARSGGGVVVEYHSYPVLKQCLIAWNSAEESGGGVFCPFHSGARLENCTLAFNSAGVSGGAVYAYQGGPVTLVSSILAGNSAPSAGGIFGGGISSAVSISTCCFWANAGGDWGGAIRTPPHYANNLFADPLFLNATYGDFRLAPGSPCQGLGAYP